MAGMQKTGQGPAKGKMPYRTAETEQEEEEEKGEEEEEEEEEEDVCV